MTCLKNGQPQLPLKGLIRTLSREVSGHTLFAFLWNCIEVITLQQKVHQDNFHTISNSWGKLQTARKMNKGHSNN